MKNLISSCVITILCMVMLSSAVIASEQPSTWAEEQIIRAVSLELVPMSLRSKYTQQITRAEFCALAVTLYETVIGEPISERKEFLDTTDLNVQKMGGLGVVNGLADNTFVPDDLITREQAAVMLANLAEVAGKPFVSKSAAFADRAQISSWALAQVGQVQGADIMSGVGNNLFAPKDPYTREQSISAILRLHDFLIVPVERVSITLNRNLYEIGEILEIDINVYPSDATDKSYSVTVEQKGKILENLPQNQHKFELGETGTITIRVTAANGMEDTQDIRVIDLDAFADEIRKEFYILVNNHRKSNGLRELEENKELQQYADIRAAEQRIVTGHTRPDGTAAGSGWHNSQNFMNTRFAENSYGVWSLEFTADAKTFADKFFSGWKESSGHNTHMLYSFDSHITMALGLDLKIESDSLTSPGIWATGY